MLTDKKISSNCEDINFCFMLFLDIYEFILCATMFNFIVSILLNLQLLFGMSVCGSQVYCFI